ncbi:UNVERIFIED_CONTAM: hypothetical protein GTU68_058883 [Idotea baltica]|nr:hypothetical protein [Idotea baltica]
MEAIIEAHERIKAYIHRTPVLTSSYLNELTGAELFFKCENFQKVGAFKARGATNAVFGLSGEVAKRGVATHSSGNHAMALSYAAAMRGIPCTVVMPNNAPDIKKAAVQGYGGFIVECMPSSKSREHALDMVVKQTGAEFVPPYNDLRVVTGQATCARELIEDVPELDTIVAPIGGGGLISGTTLACKYMSPDIDVIAAEPEQADDAYRSFKSNTLITDDAPVTVADGLKVSLKEITWHFVSHYVTNVQTASEAEIIDAMKLTWQRMKIVIEASCAVPLAVILKNPDTYRGKRIGVIITGGNVDLDTLPWLKT